MSDAQTVVAMFAAFGIVSLVFWFIHADEVDRKWHEDRLRERLKNKKAGKL